MIDPSDQELYARLIGEAERRQLTLGTAESLTGGLLGFLLARQEGAGASFAGSIVAYQTEVKRSLLGVANGPVVSARAAIEMAQSARQLLGCDLAISLTGVAGPETQEGKPVGTVFIGLADARGETSAQHFLLSGDPDTIRLAATRQAALWGLDWLTKGAEAAV